MQSPSTRQTYGAPFSDRKPIVDPTKQQAAALYNLHTLHTAQMSHTTAKVVLQFPTIGTVANTTPSATRTHWGDTDQFFPTTVARTGTGAYTLTYPSSFENENGDDETVSFMWAHAVVSSATVYGHVQCSAAGTVITLKVFDAAGAAVDITNGTTITVWAG